MTPAELNAARTAMGLTLEQLAFQIQVPSSTVEAWERGSVRIPRRYGSQIEWLAALDERVRALDAAGIAACPWVADFDRELVPQERQEVERHFKRFEAHVAECPTCKAREAYSVAHFPPLEPPIGRSGRIVVGFFRGVKRLPPWLQPAAYGAVLIGAMTAVRVAIALFVEGPSFALLKTATLALALGAYLGLVGGLVYQLVRAPFRRFGRAGDYLTGIACVWGYMLAFGIPAAIFTADPTLRAIEFWMAMGVMATFFGLIVGHMWFRETGLPLPDA